MIPIRVGYHQIDDYLSLYNMEAPFRYHSYQAEYPHESIHEHTSRSKHQLLVERAVQQDS